MKLVYILSVVAGSFLLAAAYLLIWHSTLVMQVLRLAAAIICITVGGTAVFASLSSLRILWENRGPTHRKQTKDGRAA